MGCYLPGVVARSCARCHAIESFCKSASIAPHPNGTTFIAEPARGVEHAKVFRPLVRWDFECDWQRLFRRTPKPRSFVASSMWRRLQKKIESYVALLCVVLPLKVSRLHEQTWCRKSRSLLRVCTGIPSELKTPICLLRERSFLSPNPSPPSAAPLIANTNNHTGSQKSSTAHSHKKAQKAQIKYSEFSVL